MAGRGIAGTIMYSMQVYSFDLTDIGGRASAEVTCSCGTTERALEPSTAVDMMLVHASTHYGTDFSRGTLCVVCYDDNATHFVIEAKGRNAWVVSKCRTHLQKQYAADVVAVREVVPPRRSWWR